MKLASLLGMHLFFRCTLGALCLVVGACSSDSDDDGERFSEQYKISELSASYGAFAEDGRLKVYAALLGTKGFVRLRGGDTIEVDIDGARVPTTERLLDDKVHYIADVAAPAGESDVSIAFVRGVERVVGKIKLYSAFSVPNPPPSLKIGESVDIDVDPRPDLSKWPGFFGPSLVGKAEIGGDCIGLQQIPLCAKNSAEGKCDQSYPLKLDTTKLISPPETGSCSVSLRVRLTSSGSPFEGTGPTKESFKGGGFEGHRGVTMAMQLAAR